MKGSDIVGHAGIAGIDTVINNPVLTGRVNVIGTAVLEAAKENNVTIV